MANIEYTPNLGLAKQPTGAKDWGMVLNENFEKIDREVLAKNMLTNCITEIPQNIKWEFANNVFTAKAGSKVYVPNGKNADGSNRFDELVLTEDLALTSATATQYLICVRADGVTLFQRDANNSVSGAGVTTKAGFAYDTELNLIRYYNSSGELQDVKFSLPICIVTGNSSNTFETVDQVFNGFGYIGSTVFALPNVKLLHSNGRNADGTLRNSEVILTKVLTNSASRPSTKGYLICQRNADAIQKSAVKSNWYYDEDNNYVSTLAGDKTWVIWGEYITDENDKITSFNPKLPFRAADYQEVAKLASTNNYTGENDFSAVTRFRQSVYFGRSDVDISVLPTSGNKYPTTNWFRDGKGVVLGTQDSYVTNLNTIGHRINARRTIDGVIKSVNVAAEIDVNGVGVGKAPTPPISSNGGTIATTAWCKQHIQVVSALPANPDPNIFYCIPE